MKQEGVALVPGAAFGDDRWVRLSYAVSDKELENALDRILRFAKALGAARAA
jgi:aspartate aminotransferase